MRKNLLRIIAAASYDLILIIATVNIITNFFIAQDKLVTSLDEIWVDENGLHADLSDISGTQTITCHVNVTSSDTAMIFRARNCYTDIYVDGSLISKDAENNSKFLGTSPGSRWHIIALDNSDEPVEITLVVSSCYANSHGLIDNIYVGTAHDVYEKVTKGRIVGFLVSVFLHFISVIIIVMYIYLKRLFSVGKDFLYLGISCFFSAQWASCESLLWQLFVGHSGFFHILGYLSLLAVPLSFGLLACYRLKGKFALISEIYSVVCGINLVGAVLLHITGILEFHYTLIAAHVLIAVFIPFIVMIVLSYTSEHENTSKLFLVFTLLLLLVSCVVISIVKYNIGLYADYTSYMRIALISFMFCLVIYQTSEISITFSKGLKADMLHDLALKDYLTGLYNRTALNEHTAEYEEALLGLSPLGVIQFDVNNLKRVNDTLGHEVGDKMISAAAEGLKRSFDNCCKIYRTGGDEFLVIINAPNPQAVYKDGIAKLKKYCDLQNSLDDIEYRLIIAHGFVTASAGTTLSEAIDMADVLMYQDKRDLKAKEKET
jgi:diguanylate cyclase (GGDEF)-like protein